MNRSVAARPAARRADSRTQLLRDMERDPEGSFWQHLPDGRRLPPCYLSEHVAPNSVQRRVGEFFAGFAGVDPRQFELLHNWLAEPESIDLVRWLPEFEDQGVFPDLVVWVPVELDSWPASLGWDAALDPERLARWRRSLVHSGEMAPDPEFIRRVREARLEISRLAQRVARGRATGEEQERYAAALQVVDPSPEFYELAKELRPRIVKIVEDLGL